MLHELKHPRLVLGKWKYEGNANTDCSYYYVCWEFAWKMEPRQKQITDIDFLSAMNRMYPQSLRNGSTLSHCSYFTLTLAFSHRAHQQKNHTQIQIKSDTASTLPNQKKIACELKYKSLKCQSVIKAQLCRQISHWVHKCNHVCFLGSSPFAPKSNKLLQYDSFILRLWSWEAHWHNLCSACSEPLSDTALQTFNIHLKQFWKNLNPLYHHVCKSMRDLWISCPDWKDLLTYFTLHLTGLWWPQNHSVSSNAPLLFLGVGHNVELGWYHSKGLHHISQGICQWNVRPWILSPQCIKESAYHMYKIVDKRHSWHCDTILEIATTFDVPENRVLKHEPKESKVLLHVTQRIASHLLTRFIPCKTSTNVEK